MRVSADGAVTVVGDRCRLGRVGGGAVGRRGGRRGSPPRVIADDAASPEGDARERAGRRACAPARTRRTGRPPSRWRARARRRRAGRAGRASLHSAQPVQAVAPALRTPSPTSRRGGGPGRRAADHVEDRRRGPEADRQVGEHRVQRRARARRRGAGRGGRGPRPARRRPAGTARTTRVEGPWRLEASGPAAVVRDVGHGLLYGRYGQYPLVVRRRRRQSLDPVVAVARTG